MNGALTAVGGPRRAARERVQLAVSYAILVTLLVIVIFPFYWMTVTSFKSETQMRSLTSMFWPRPFAGENYGHLLAKTEFLGWYRNSIVVAATSTTPAASVSRPGLISSSAAPTSSTRCHMAAGPSAQPCRPPARHSTPAIALTAEVAMTTQSPSSSNAGS